MICQNNRIIQIMLISILFLLTQATSLIIDPVNSSCIDTVTPVQTFISSLNSTLNRFTLPALSQTYIQLDLRHLDSIPILSDNSSLFTFQVWISVGGFETIETIDTLSVGINKYSFYVIKETFVALLFDISDEYSAYKYLLLDSASIAVILQNQRIPEEQETFLFIIQNLNDVNLPYNRPDLTLKNDYYLDEIPSTTSESRLTTILSANDYWDAYNSFAVPYFPYFSNCHGQSTRIYISQAMQNSSDCTLISLDQTVPIEEFNFGSTPTADRCVISRNCIYDEVMGLKTEFPYWQTLPASTPFYITRDKVSSQSYNIHQQFDSTELVQCQILTSEGTNSSELYPMKVKLLLEYYQMSSSTKRMINCSIQFSLYVTSTTNFQYQLEIQTKPLNHTYIMLAFGFQWYVYMIIFLLIGLISNLENFILWLWHSCVSRKEKKPFRIRIYLSIIRQIMQGTLTALILFIILLFCVTVIMNGKIFDQALYDSNLDKSVPRVFWDSVTFDNVIDYTSSKIVNKRAGRMGAAFFFIGLLLVFYMSKYFIGKEKTKQEYQEYEVMGRRFKPIDWNQGKFLFGTFIFIVIQFFFIYFAYSNLYSENIWAFIVMMKIVQIFMEQITKFVYEDLLPCLPLKVITDITAYMNTLSANNFYDFLFSFLIDVAITMFEKAYVSQLQNIVVQKIQEKMEQFKRFYANLINETEEEVEEKQSKEQQEQLQENLNVFMDLGADTDMEEVKFFEDDEADLYNHEEEAILTNIQQIKLAEDSLKRKLEVYLKRSSQAKTQPNKNTINGQDFIRDQQQKDEDEEINDRSSIFQMLLDNIILIFTFFLQPFVVLVYWITYDESQILSKYGISSNTVILYLLSAVVIAVFTIINVVLIFHLLESYLEIDFEEPITSLLGRFQNRGLFWKADDQDINIKIATNLRGADHYCLSFQFFFVMTIYISSMILIMLGISIMMNIGYNPFHDLATVPIFCFWSLFLLFFGWVGSGFAKKINLWGCADFQEQEKYQNPNRITNMLLKQEIPIHQPNGTDEQTEHQLIINVQSQSSLMERASFKSRKLVRKKEKQTESLFSQSSKNVSYSEKSHTADISTTKLDTICHKLQSTFESNKFLHQYFTKHKQYLKDNFDKILPLMTQLPELPSYTNNNNKEELLWKGEGKNLLPSVVDILLSWKSVMEKKGQQRQSKGLQMQASLKRCSFCYELWSIYFYNKDDRMCLRCSQALQKKKK